MIATLRRFATRLAGLTDRHAQDTDFNAELQAHIDLHTDDGIRAGLDPREARRRAVLKLGGIESTKEIHRDQRGFPFFDSLIQDLRYGLRTLRKCPGFAATAIVSLALGIGANTAVFSLVHGTLLRPLPVPEPQQLVSLGRKPANGAVSMPEFNAMRTQARSFENIAGHRGSSKARLTQGAVDEWVESGLITTRFFETLGLSLAAGREFQAGEATSNGPRAVILSDKAWRAHFNADPQAVGRIVTIEGIPHEITGIAPPASWLPVNADVFVPIRETGSGMDRGTNTEVFGRLKPGVTIMQAAAELQLASDDVRRIDPDKPSKYPGLGAIPYQQWLTGDLRPKLLLLLGSVGLLLLIACLNLVSLLLARLATRQREIGVRLALGSSRGRLIQQFIVEGSVICLAGGAIGLALARWFLDAFLATAPLQLPLDSRGIGLDTPVLLFTAAVCFAAVLLVSLGPALMSSRIALHDTLKQRSTGSGAADRLTLRNLLIVAETTAATALLVSAALLIHSLYKLNQQQLGFDPRGVYTFWIPPVQPGKPDANRAVRQAAVLEQLQSVPGVHNVAAVNVLPLTGQNNFPAQRLNHPEQSIGGMEIRIITPGYFETLGTPLVRGRRFGATDAARSTPTVIVNEALARTWWPASSPLGDRIELGRFKGRLFMEEATREVVGVVADSKTIRLTEPARPTLFIPVEQASWYSGGMSWVVRADGETAGFAERLRTKVRQVDPAMRVDRLRTLGEIVAATKSDTRFDASLFGSFAGLALLVTAIGVYGLLSFSVTRRSGEIGTRMALGASRGAVLGMILKQGLALVTTGVVLGLVAAAGLTRFLSKMLFGVQPTDALSFAAVAALLLTAGLLASYLPARRATKVDPLIALRAD